MCMKGGAGTILNMSLLPLFRSTLAVSATEYQLYQTVILLPWAMKCAYGYLCDFCPLFGYSKRPYIVAASVIGSGSALCLGLSLTSVSAVSATALAFTISAAFALTDLMSESAYASKLVAKPETSTSVVSLVWLLISAGSVAGAVLVGILADTSSLHVAFYTVGGLCLQTCVPALWGCIDAEYVPCCPSAAITRTGIAVTLFAFMLVPVCLQKNTWLLLVYALGSSCLLILCSWSWLPRMMARCNIYMFLTSVLYLQLPGALDYWYTADRVSKAGK